MFIVAMGNSFGSDLYFWQSLSNNGIVTSLSRGMRISGLPNGDLPMRPLIALLALFAASSVAAQPRLIAALDIDASRHDLATQTEGGAGR
jgi:hypothetical protein